MSSSAIRTRITKLEDLLARRPQGVSALVLDAEAARFQRAAAEAAGDAEVDVYMTRRRSGASPPASLFRASPTVPTS